MLKKDKNISYYEYFHVLLSSKTSIFYVLSIAFVTIIVYPIIIPHLFHPTMIYHIVIHIISFNITLFLTLISVLSFKKTKSKKVLLTSSSFSFLLVVESLYLLQASGTLGEFPIPYIGGEISHILLLFMIALFAMGVLRVEKK